MNQEMACISDADDWAAQQFLDEQEMRQRAEEAINHLNDVVRAVEEKYGMTLETTRAHIRFLDSFVSRR